VVAYELLKSTFRELTALLRVNAVEEFVEALCYKMEGLRFEYR
jgi:hypothetical protein